MLQIDSPVQTAVVDWLEGISVLLDSRQRAAFLPFLNREISVSQAALEVGELPNTMLYRVRRWQRLGLLQEARTVPHPKGKKGGMPLYRSSAPSYFIPYAATSAEDLLTLAREMYTPIFADFLNHYVRSGAALSDDWGVRFEGAAGGWQVRPSKSLEDQCQPSDLTAPPTMLEYVQLELNQNQAKAMQLELLAVLQRYATPTLPSAALEGTVRQTYRVILGMV